MLAGREDQRPFVFFIIGASDVAFVLIFFLIMSGGQSVRPDSDTIEVPYKTATNPDVYDTSSSTIRIDIEQTDRAESRLSVSLESRPYLKAKWTFENAALLDSSLHMDVADRLQRFADSVGIPDYRTPSVVVYGHPLSAYGMTASILAACETLEYECSLIYRVSGHDYGSRQEMH